MVACLTVAAALCVTEARAQEAPRAVLDRYCVTCHNQRAKVGGLALDTLNLEALDANTGVGEAIVRKMRGGMMPPGGSPRPDAATYAGMRHWFETRLDAIAAASPNPGRKESLHRLNRVEYHNAIRDLLALDVDVANLLPADDGSFGFDNIAGVLKINQALLERYLMASKKISRLAVGGVPLAEASTYRVPPDESQYERAEGMPVGTRGGRLIHHYFPVDGEYEFKIELAGGPPGENEQIEVAIDGERVQLLKVTPQTPRSNDRVAGTNAFTLRMAVLAGPRDVAVGFLQTNAAYTEGQRNRFIKPRVYDLTGTMTITMTYLGSVTINGPFSVTGPGDTPSRRRVLVCKPVSAAEEAACARRIVSTLARRAYRGTSSDADVAQLLDFYRAGRANGGSFEQGVEMALRRLLVSPSFLYRIESDPAGIAPNTNYRIGDLELASRLSFFLWSSIPDDALVDAAKRGTLRQPLVLEKQVKRMLADPRAEAMATNFLDQWLYVRNVPNVAPADDLFPDFDFALKDAFQKETRMFFASVMREDRSVIDLLTADYTFVNERLARHYGIPNVTGRQFRRVTLADDHRRGLLGQGSILTVSSRPNRTSPVLRGKWILQNLLASPPPAPPANVPPLPEKKDGAANVPATMRERMAQHRANPVCASCHSMIDPPGFALENFDAVGKWRDLDDSFKPIDAAGQFPDGTKFDGVNGLRRALVANPERFMTAMTEKMLVYALGRGLEPYDSPAVRKIVRDAGTRNHAFSSVILGIVTSTPFQMRRSDAKS